MSRQPNGGIPASREQLRATVATDNGTTVVRSDDIQDGIRRAFLALDVQRRSELLRALSRSHEEAIGREIAGGYLRPPVNPGEANLAPVKMPQARHVGRVGDMSPSASIRVGLDSDNDVFLAAYSPGTAGSSVEFCTLTGGGHSPATRLALIALMVAIEEDNARTPHKDFFQQ